MVDCCSCCSRRILQVAGHGHQLEGVDAGPDGVGQLLFPPGLDEVAADLAAVDRLHHRADVRVGGQDHADDVGEPLLDRGAQLGARHLGHPLIGQQDRHRLAGQDLQRLASRAGGDDTEPVLEAPAGTRAGCARRRRRRGPRSAECSEAWRSPLHHLRTIVRMLAREPQLETGAPPRCVDQIQGTAVIVRDLAAEMEPQAGPLADFAGREERIEDALGEVGGIPGPLSATMISTPCRSGREAMRTRPPSPAARRALSNRFRKIWFSAGGRPRISPRNLKSRSNETCCDRCESSRMAASIP